MVTVQRKSFLHIADEARVARFHHHIGALMLVAVEIDIFQLADDLPENHRKFREPLHVLDAGNGRGLLLRELVTFPDGEVLVRLAHEQDFTVVRVERIRREQ